MKISRSKLRRIILREFKVLTTEGETSSSTLTTFRNEKMMCVNLLGGLGFAVSKGMEAFKKASDKLLSLKEEGGSEIKDILKDYNKKLAVAYYFGVKGASEDEIKAKFGISGKDAKAKIKEITAACRK